MSDPLITQDPIAERRYAYAQAAARERDWPAAAEVLEQTLEIDPRWAKLAGMVRPDNDRAGDE